MHYPKLRIFATALALLHAIGTSAAGAPDLSSRNTITFSALEGSRYAGVVATGGPWVAASSAAWRNGNYDRAVSEAFNDYYLARVTVTGTWNGTPLQQYVIPKEAAGLQIFGEALGLEGNRLAVGAPSEGFAGVVSCDEFDYFCFFEWRMRDPGQVYLYQFDGSGFALERSISRGDELARFGHALALQGSRLLVGAPGGAPGRAHLFDADTGEEMHTFFSRNDTPEDDFGTALALSDSLAVIGAPASNTVYVFEQGSSGWALLAQLTNNDAGASFGAALAVDGERVLIGAPGIGRAYLYLLTDIEEGGALPLSDGNWHPSAKFYNNAESAFGAAVAIQGDTLWISEPRNRIDDRQHGSVHRYEPDPEVGWSLVESYAAVDHGQYWDDFGAAMATSDGRLTVGTPAREQQDVFATPEQVYDTDGDQVSQFTDNCPDIANTEQADLDVDGVGDACDEDIDGDRLSNEEEALIGSDPRNPDTDGDRLPDDRDPVPLHKDIDDDGLEDPDDNCPETANPLQENTDGDRQGDACDGDIDNDSLGNDDEIAGGTDPYDRDTDGDGHEDDYDLFPNDEYDGWPRMYRFALPASEHVAVDGALALAASRGSEARAYRWTDSQWAEIAAPDLPVENTWRTNAMALSGTTAAFAVETFNSGGRITLLVYEWRSGSGWTRVQHFSPPFRVNYVDELRLEGDRMVIVGSPLSSTVDFRALAEIYVRRNGVFEFSGDYRSDGAAYQFEAAISGSRIFLGDDIIFSSDPSVLHLLSDTGEVLASTPTTIKDSTSSSACNNESNIPLIGAAHEQLLVSTQDRDVWVGYSQGDDAWNFTDVLFGQNNIAGLGDNNQVGLEHPVPLIHPISGEQTNYNLKVISMLDGSSLGMIPSRRDSICWLSWDTDGLTVITASDDVVEIYPLDRDNDGVADREDNCRNQPNPGQEDSNGNGTGDACDLPPGC